jgi:hypothetical protein
MDKQPFWMTSLNIKGSERIGRNSYASRLGKIDRRFLHALLKTSPGWGEVSYFNTFERDSPSLEKRDYLLGWVFAIIEKQYGFAMDIAVKGLQRFGDPIFEELSNFAFNKIRQAYVRLPFYILNKVFQTLLRIVG